MAMKVREALPSDFEDIYRLLKRLNSTSLSKFDWQKLTQVEFSAAYSHYGYVLEDENCIVGFLGTIFSQREIAGDNVNFCNIHSWIVAPEAKGGGINLLMKSLRLKDHVITNFTASEVPYKVFQSLKFKEIEYRNYKLLPFQSLNFSSRVSVCKITSQNAKSVLKEDNLKLFNDHKHFNNVQFLELRSGNETAFVISKKKTYTPAPLLKFGILKKFVKNKLFLGELHYISNSGLFFKCFSSTRSALQICKELGVIGILSADTFIPKDVSIKKSYYPRKRPFMYRHSSITGEMVDTLYSEFFVLNF